MNIVIGILCAGGATLMLISAVAMVRARDAFGRINVLSPATGLGLPLMVIGGYLHRLTLDGFSLPTLVKALVTLAALLIVSSVASNTLARAAYLSGAPVDPRTDPQDLAQEPSGDASSDDLPPERP